MGKNVVETIMGAVVLLVALIFVVVAYKSGNLQSTSNGYTLTARFNEIGNITVGADVRVSGVKVGSVIGQQLDRDSYQAVIELAMDDDIKLPVDSSVAIVSDGLLGGKYLSLVPGADEDMLEDGDELEYTQDAINLESLMGKFAFGSVKSEAKSEKNELDD